MSTTPTLKSDDVLAKCYQSTGLFGKTFFPDDFILPFSPKIHGKFFKATDDDSKQRVCILAPRGIGKTTCLKTFIKKEILFRKANFVVYVSAAADHAIMQTEDVKRELVTNDVVVDLVGDATSKEFSKLMWVTDWGTCVLPRGAGQQIRGLNYRGNRPDLIIVDDLERKENVQSEDQREKLKRWFFSDLMNSVARGRNWRVIVIGTLLHQDALLADLQSDPRWHTLNVGICDEQYKSNWPEFMTDSDIQSELKSHRHQGLMDEFCREFLNIPYNEESAIFKKEYFKYHKDRELQMCRNNNNPIEVVVVDPAKTVNSRSAYSAIMQSTLDLGGRKIYFNRLLNERLMPDKLIEATLDMCYRSKSHVLGIEVTSLETWLTKPFKDEIIKRGLPIELVEIKPVRETGKDDRISSALLPYYRMGLISHSADGDMGVLEAQLMSLGFSKYRDAADVAAYTIGLMEKADLYFGPGNSEQIRYDEMENEDSIRDFEYGVL